MLFAQNYVYSFQIDKSTCGKRGVTALTATSVQVVPLSVYESQGFQLNLNSFLLQGIS